ncbi:MAG: phage tail tube protein [Veillonella caviae]|nr:phage tail tube protein [Veillonella caviae]
MNNFAPQQVMLGTHGELWINGKYMAQVIGFKAEVELTKEAVNQVKTMFEGYKYTGYKGKGNVKLNHTSSFFVTLMADNMKAARQTVCTIISKVSDPDAKGTERVIIRDATFDKLTLTDWSAKKLMEDGIDFTFTDFDFLDTVED